MFFASDNSGPVPQQVLDALASANTGYQSSYGADTIMDEVREQIRDIFEAPEAAVYLVATGTAANALALATMCEPFDTVFCSPVAHIHEDECNAPEFYTGGAKLTLVGEGDKIGLDALRKSIEGEGNRGVHGPQRGPVSITQVTEKGRIYSVEEIRDICDLSKSYGLSVHLDGARFANAMVALGCTAAEMTWKAGVDVVSFGGTKNGLMGVEAVIFFDSKLAWEFELRRKRGAHLFSKHRYLSAQMQAYLKDGLWLDMAAKANANAAHLIAGLREIDAVEFVYEPDANLMFVRMPRAYHHAVLSQGAMYHLSHGDLDGDPDEILESRFVCDWSIEIDQIDRFLGLLKAVDA